MRYIKPVLIGAAAAGASVLAYALYKSNGKLFQPPYVPPVITDNPFGAYIFTGKTTEDKINIAHSMGIKFIRRAVSLQDDPADFLADYELYVQAGFSMVININLYPSGHGPQPFATDLADYASKLKAVIPKIIAVGKPALFVIENEELNGNYHSGTPSQYLAQLRVAVPIVHSFGVKVTNGGLTSAPLCVGMYDNFSGKRAQQYAAITIPGSMKSNLPTALKQKADSLNQLIQGYKSIPMDFTNIHWYEPIALRVSLADATTNANLKDNGSVDIDVTALEATIAYLQNEIRRPVISNESGFMVQTKEGVDVMCDVFKKQPLCIYFANSGTAGAVAFSTDDGGLLENGEALRDFISTNYPSR